MKEGSLLLACVSPIQDRDKLASFVETSVHNYLMVGYQEGPIIEEPSTAFASEAGLSPFSSTLRFKPENVSPENAM